jgi:hypothetical protein
MSGRYLRKKRPGPRDPTMTHVDDPHLYKVGDCIRTYEGWSLITFIEDARFGDPDTRFATLAHFSTNEDDVMLDTPGWYDFRPFDVENFHENAVSVETGQRPDWTIEAAREAYERAMAAHMCGFVP